ncbi:hypothetical protein [Bremerella alba]|uniref:Uncharacterized protein n=1 Tax=Bremerella alba TaxID=980252 RepID=A0A7V8V8Y1_9BACT|nr:hypothetical protein [Bremerella alba]MBA2116831.1 hypothetical protein [Bremerella alba]
MSFNIDIALNVNGELANQIEDHNAAHSAWQADSASLKALRTGLLNADPLGIEPSGLSASREKLTTDYLALLQREAKLAESALSLLVELGPLAEKSREDAEANAAKVLEKVIAKMAKAGITEQSMPGWGHNEAAARHQLEYQAAQSSDYREAFGFIEGAKLTIREIGEQRRAITEALKAIREDAKRLVHKVIAGDSAGLQLT